MTNFFIALQYLLPQHFVSRVVGKLAASEIGFIKSTFINIFKWKFGISLAQAERKNTQDYTSFNDFFCRALDTDARPIAEEKQKVTSPADGAFSQLGPIKEGRIFQAKGQTYSCEELLACDSDAETYKEGEFATIYLSPKDYHRLHMPVDGKLRKMTFIPGDLFSVNQITAENVPRVFSRNERLVCHFDTEKGPMVMVLVGAMIVASIETVWAGTIAPSKSGVSHKSYDDGIELKKGEEMGRFKLGSTVILLYPEKTLNWEADLKASSPIKMGEAIATLAE
ncbi:archaetidylserine decarboxylase [Agaribacterium sp. ZY112]|uniref:archaetidylserine decarboxylase n=1 Tax=Agaribacterium sp. ZY112 TaxID=3233574 RepID=UPI0035251206